MHQFWLPHVAFLLVCLSFTLNAQHLTSDHGGAPTQAASRVAPSTVATSIGRFRPVEIALRPGPQGVRPRETRPGRVLVEGPGLVLLKVWLSLQEYDKGVRGSKPYVYVLEKAEQRVQLDVLKQIGTPGNYQVSRRYRNVLQYLFTGCPIAQRAAQKLDFTDRDIVEVILAGERCGQYTIDYTDADAAAPPPANYHHVGVTTVRLLGKSVANEGLSLGLSYTGDYGLNRNKGLRAQLSLGLYRLRYALPIEANIKQTMMRGQLLLSQVIPTGQEQNLQLGFGYTIYNNLGGGDGPYGRHRGSFGLPTLQFAFQQRAVTAFIAGQSILLSKTNLRPESLAELGLRLRL